MRKLLSLGAIALSATMFVSSIANAATVTVYTDRTAFEAALTGVKQTEDFSGTSNPFFTFTGGSVSVSGGQLNDQINDDTNVSTTYGFASSVFGFGGDWNLAGPGGQGSGIEATLNLVGGGTAVVTPSLASSLAGTFFGFISNVAFNSIDLREANPNVGVETYALDNVTAGQVAPVPLPASFSLLLAAFGGIALMRRRKAVA